MPLFITTTHGTTLIVKGESIRFPELHRKIIRAVSMAGHALAIRRDAISFIEHVPEEHYLKIIEEAKKKKEEQKGGTTISRPVMMIPPGRR